MTSAPRLPSEDLLQLAESALLEGRPETTLELCRRVLSVDPDHVAAQYLEGEALRDLREAEEAEDVFRALLDQEPQHVEAWTGLGNVLLDQGRFDEAGRCFARALRIADDQAEAWYGRAMVRERRGDHAGARRDYIRAWRLSERFPPPRELSRDELRALLLEAASSAGDDVRAWIEAAPMIVLDHPDPATCDAYEPPASPSELLGHLTLHPTTEEDGGWTRFPPAVLLFRRNLERWADDRSELVDALRHGVLAHVEAWLQSPSVVA
jgi:tetratricopeptide (TPR) repeat protein